MKKQEKNEGLKSLYLELQNFKNISKRVIDIGGRSMILLGGNGAGKSSVIQAMMSPMDAKIVPSEPIMLGEERATIKHTIGGLLKGADGQLINHEYTLDLVFTEKDKRGKLEVFNEKGEKLKSPASLIKSIIGNVSFDPNKWLSEPKAKKLEMIKNISGAGKEIDIVGMEIKEMKDLIKRKKDRADDLEGALKNHEFTKEEIDIYSIQKPIELLQEQLSAVSNNQEQWDSIKLKVDGFVADGKRCWDKINNADTEIERLKKLILIQEEAITNERLSLSKIEQNIEKGNTWLSNTPRPSSDVITNQINEAIAHNKNFDRITMLENQTKEMRKAKQEVEELKGKAKELEEKRSNIIKGSQLAIEGFSFDDNELYIDGLPIEEGQINTQRLWEIGVDIAIALNPNYKVIFIQDGSLFDKKHLLAIVKKIEDKGYMAVIEAVSYEGGELHVDFFEKEI